MGRYIELNLSWRLHDTEALEKAYSELPEEAKSGSAYYEDGDGEGPGEMVADHALMLDELMTHKLDGSYLEWGVDDFATESRQTVGEEDDDG